MNFLNDDKQDYGWVKGGMIFPFIDNVERFVIAGFMHRLLFPCLESCFWAFD